VIVIDSSAIVAIFRQEDDALRYAQSIAGDDDPTMSAANVVETSIALRGLKKIAPASAEIARARGKFNDPRTRLPR